MAPTNDRKTEIRANGDEIMIGGSTFPGYLPNKTQQNIVNVSVTQDGNLIKSLNYSRSGAHEGGHSGGLPHPWMTAENVELKIDLVNERDKSGDLIKTNRKYVYPNIMNSQEAGASWPNASGDNISAEQLESMKRTIDRQQPKK